MVLPIRMACTVLVLTAAAATACGVEAQRAPEPVPVNRLPSTSSSTAPSTVSARGRVWGARDGRLVPVFTELQGTSPASRLRAVLDLGDLDGGPPTALQPGTRLLRASRSGDTVVVSLSAHVRQVPPADLPLALGQLVLTVTEDAGVQRVHVRAERVPIVYVDASGRRVNRALERSDFAALAQDDEPD